MLYAHLLHMSVGIFVLPWQNCTLQQTLHGLEQLFPDTLQRTFAEPGERILWTASKERQTRF